MRRLLSNALRAGVWLALAGCSASSPSGDDARAADSGLTPAEAGAPADAAAPDAPTTDADSPDAAGPGACGAAAGGAVWADWPMPDPTAGGTGRAQSYDTTTAGVAVDRVTALSWQRVLPAQTFDWRAAADYCACLVLGGHEDWRLPTRIELVSLVDFTRADPAIDAATFPDTPFEWFWTSSPLADSDPPAAWYVAFFDGDTHHASVDVSYHVRCVRGGGAAAQPRYAVAADGSAVTDMRTGLTWQRAVDPAQRTWDGARTYCADLPLAGGGWRLPDMKELQTLIDEGRTMPAIDPVAFPGTPGEGFWTSPPLVATPPFAWFVSFESGIAYNSDAAHPYSVRCVR